MKSNHKRAGAVLLTAAAMFIAGCRQDMHNQPKYKPLRASNFFQDGSSARPLVEGLSTPTVVTDSSAAEVFDVKPILFMNALRRALAQDPETQLRPGADRPGA